MKTCSLCSKSLPLTSFRQRSGRADYQSYCRACERRYSHQSSATRFSRFASNVKRKYGGKFTAQDARHLGKPWGIICYLCGDIMAQGDAVELDHVQPRRANGEAKLDNLAWTHRRCNRIKHDMTLEELLPHLEKMVAALASKHPSRKLF